MKTGRWLDAWTVAWRVDNGGRAFPCILVIGEAAPATQLITWLFFEHLEKVMVETQFINKEQPGQVMNKLRRLFSRARPETQELNILRGILTSIEKKF